jgi:hypothetical protein
MKPRTRTPVAIAITFGAAPLLLHAPGQAQHLSDATSLELHLSFQAAPPVTAPEMAPGTPPHEESDATAIAKKLQNPVANLISLPIQWNVSTGVGPDKNDLNVINIQPVIPFHLTEDWNLITRTILPIVSTPVPDWAGGLGDTVLSLFLSPAAPGRFIWGAGPAFQFPTATDDDTGQGKWCAGPTFVGLAMEGPWVVGGLINNVWSFAGESDRPSVNQMTFQPFINYNFPEGWYLSVSPIITADWTADSDDQWTVPVGGGVGKVFRIGDQMMNAQVATFYNVISPDFGPEWTMRFQLTFVFPTR